MKNTYTEEEQRERHRRYMARRFQMENGRIYAIRFTTGTIKVGKSGDIQRRLQAHKSYAVARGFDIDRVWYSDRHIGYGDAEKKLIAVCGNLGTPTDEGSEYFDGISRREYDIVCAFAVRLALDAARLAYVKKLSEAVGGDDSKTWVEAHAAMIARWPHLAAVYGAEAPLRNAA